MDLSGMTVGELLKYAEANNLAVDKRWGKKKLISFLLPHQSTPYPDEESKPMKYKNVFSGSVIVFGRKLKPGCVYEATEENLKDIRGMVKLQRLIEFGMIK